MTWLHGLRLQRIGEKSKSKLRRVVKKGTEGRRLHIDEDREIVYSMQRFRPRNDLFRADVVFISNALDSKFEDVPFSTPKSLMRRMT